ncbi:MAG: hypothetical protein ACI33P_01275 [Lysinibacillus sp.]
MNQFKKRLEEQTPISPIQTKRIKHAVLHKKNNKRNARLIPLAASLLFGILVIAGSFLLLPNEEPSPPDTGTSPSITDERGQVASYLETGEEHYLAGVPPEMILKTYLFTKEKDGSMAPEVEALAIQEFDIQWTNDLTYHEQKFEEMLQHVTASIDHNHARMHIKSMDIPFITVEFQKENDVWRISKIE